jgi:hypothetical protein
LPLYRALRIMLNPMPPPVVNVQLAAMKIHRSFAALCCFKLVASLSHGATTGTVLDKPVGTEYMDTNDHRGLVACGTSDIALAEYINSVTLSKKILSLSGTTPLDLALQHLVAFSSQVQLSTCVADHKDRLKQRFAYLAFVFSTGIGGTYPWFAGPNECQWLGISCVGNRVTQVSFPYRSLDGTIPDDVGLWTSLTYFDVTSNQLIGSLPSSIGKWTGLTFFAVTANQLTGTVPTDVSKWTSINEAYFEANIFTGTMPTIGNNFCPAQGGSGVDLWANCEIRCDCCNGCI